MERCLIRRWGPIIPGWGGTWTMIPCQIFKWPLGLGFPYLAGRYRPGGCPFSSTDTWNFRYMETFLAQVWDFIVPGCGGTSMFPTGNFRRPLAPS